jgi:hypothetical protein
MPPRQVTADVPCGPMWPHAGPCTGVFLADPRRQLATSTSSPVHVSGSSVERRVLGGDQEAGVQAMRARNIWCHSLHFA